MLECTVVDYYIMHFTVSIRYKSGLRYVVVDSRFIGELRYGPLDVVEACPKSVDVA